MGEPAKRHDEDQGEQPRSRRGLGLTRLDVREIMKKNPKAMAKLASEGGAEGGADTTRE